MGLSDKIVNRAVKTAHKPLRKLLAKASRKDKFIILRSMVGLVSVEEIRRKVITGFEGEFRRKLEDNPSITVQELIQEYLDEPEAVGLFKDLGMGEEHLRAMAKNVIAERIKGD